MPVLSNLLMVSMVTVSPHPTWRSEVAAGHVLELFTSEGCSSCPPAERYLLSLRREPALWKTVFPVQFHVDYWDYLGWSDSYARPAYTERQWQYARQWGDTSVYTPCFVSDGRATRAPWDTVGHAGPDVGVLSVTQTGGDTFAVTFAPVLHAPGQVRVVGVVVAENIRKKVKTGENRGRTLDHAFVAVNARDTALHPKGGLFSGTITLEHRGDMGPLYVVFWVTRGASMAPIQVVGGLFP